MTNLAHAIIHESSRQDRANPPPISALALVETVTAAEVFTNNGLDLILERIEREARSYALDISTDKGRKEIASLAHKVAKSKTALDKLGKDLVSEWKAQSKKVDVERARAWERLETLQKEIRQPLTDWENRDADRIARHEAGIASISELASNVAANWMTIPLDAMNARLRDVLSDSADWEEFAAKAKHARDEASEVIAAAILKREKHDAEQAELVRLRKEEHDRKQREHEERLKAQAAEKARKEAEEKAQKAAEAEGKRVAAERAKAEDERLRIAHEKEEAEVKARKAEEAKKAAEEKAKRDADNAEKRRVAEAQAAEQKRLSDIAAVAAKAKRDIEEAARKERERIEAEQRADSEATARREADKKHRAKINGEALAALVVAINTAISPTDQARAIIEAIANGEVPHIRIQY